MDNTEKYTTLISFCTGIRGIERGIERVIPNIRTICSVERESFIIENLVAEMESGLLGSHPIWPDVTNFPADKFRGMVDILTGGYPCPGESVAGKRLGEDDPRWLWRHFERAINIIQPTICFFENVRGHITKGLPTVIESLEELGYRVHWGVFSAEETGASHKRERVFIMAIREGGVGLANSEHHGCDGSEDSKGTEQGNNRDSTRANAIEQSQGCSRESGGHHGELANTNTNNSRSKQNTESGKLRANSTEQPSIDSGKSNAREVEEGCKTMADSYNNGERTQSREVRSQSETTEGEEQWKERHEIQRERSGSKFGYCRVTKMDYTRSNRFESNNPISARRNSLVNASEYELGHTDISGLQGRDSEKCGKCTYEWITRANESFARKYHVARPGQPQFRWEEPRTSGYTNRLPASLRSMWSSSRKNFAKMLGEKIWEETDFRIKAHFKPEVGLSAHGYNFREDFLRALGNSVYEDTAELAFRTLLKKHGII